MMNQIGYFQLSNLMRNKVPFAFFSLDFNVPSSQDEILKPIIQIAHPLTSTEIHGKITQMDLKKDHPIVLICPDGQISSSIAQNLTETGFLNVYFIKGGWVQLLEEIS